MPTMDFEGQVKRTLAHIDASKTIPPANKELIRSYHRHMVLSDISAA